jgi:hypothetical protein
MCGDVAADERFENIGDADAGVTCSRLGIKIRNVGARCGNLDIDAYDAGRKAGDAASFGRPVEGRARSCA